jgi:hypothetical protein
MGNKVLIIDANKEKSRHEKEKVHWVIVNLFAALPEKCLSSNAQWYLYILPAVTIKKSPHFALKV